jgi:hypothetical protein
MKSRLKELKDNHEFRKGEGWEITTLSEDIDWLIEQAEKVEQYEIALEDIHSIAKFSRPDLVPNEVREIAWKVLWKV